MNFDSANFRNISPNQNIEFFKTITNYAFSMLKIQCLVIAGFQYIQYNTIHNNIENLEKLKTKTYAIRNEVYGN